MDDTMTFKNYNPQSRLKAQGSGWDLCIEDTKERHGWAIFKSSRIDTQVFEIIDQVGNYAYVGYNAL